MFDGNLESLKQCDIKHLEILKKGDYLYEQGDKAQSFYYINSGLVGLHHCLSNGKEALIRIYSDKEFFGYRTLLGGRFYHCSAKILQDTYLVQIIPHNVEFFIKENFDLMRHLVFNLCSELQDAESRLGKIAFVKSVDRVLESTKYLKDTYPNYKWTYREIAQYAGCETETTIRLSRTLKKDKN